MPAGAPGARRCRSDRVPRASAPHSRRRGGVVAAPVLWGGYLLLEYPLPMVELWVGAGARDRGDDVGGGARAALARLPVGARRAGRHAAAARADHSGLRRGERADARGRRASSAAGRNTALAAVPHHPGARHRSGPVGLRGRAAVGGAERAGGGLRPGSPPDAPARDETDRTHLIRTGGTRS